jgi:3-oxoacyl-[acyl-carrier protein] reductase
MEGRLVGKSALITGGSGGIGAATAERLASEGAAVAIVDINEARAGSVAAQIAATGVRAQAITCDVSDIASAETAVATCVSAFGRLDILVCCAGIIRDNLLFRMSDEDWHGVIETHLTGTFAFARAAQRTMTEQRYGKMVFLSSVSALGNRGQVNYSAAKAGLQAMARTLAMELGPFGINVNTVAPGFVETDMTRATADRLGLDFEAFKAQALEQIPRRILGQPHHIANVIAFLCSDESEYISGQTIYAAGGPRG